MPQFPAESTFEVTCAPGVLVPEEDPSQATLEDPNQATLEIDVRFDSTQTDVESVASALSQLLETAMSTPGILEDGGSIVTDEFYVKRKF